jgi:hypothetical protein
MPIATMVVVWEAAEYLCDGAILATAFSAAAFIFSCLLFGFEGARGSLTSSEGSVSGSGSGSGSVPVSGSGSDSGSEDGLGSGLGSVSGSDSVSRGDSISDSICASMAASAWEAPRGPVARQRQPRCLRSEEGACWSLQVPFP